MSVKIKKRICPPKWFSLDNYKNVSDFGILEWRNELLLRALILKYLGVSGFSLLSSSVLAYGVSISEFEGFLKVSRGFVTGGFSPREISDYAPLGTAKMKDLRFQAYRDKEAFKSGSASQDLVERWKKVLPIIFLEKDFLSAMELDISIEHEEKIFSPHLLKVNLGAPDSVLVKAFSDWISCARASRIGGEIEVVKSPNTGSKTYGLWKDYGVLPYLDLVIWAAQEDIKLPLDFLAEAVVPYKSSGREFIAKTTIPKARILIQGLDSIELICFHEVASKKLTALV